MATFVPGGMGGSETYVRELVRELAAGPLDVATLVPPVATGWSGGLLPERTAAEIPLTSLTSSRSKALAVGLVRGRALRRRLREFDVVHYPFTVPVPAPGSGRRRVVTLHDVQHHDLPELFDRGTRLYRRALYDRAARTADAVITISEFAKSRIVAHLGIDPDRVTVAPLGVRRNRLHVAPPEREPFVLYPARGWPHKNHRRLLEAFRILRRARPDLSLVLTGATADELPELPAGVRSAGRVSREALDDLYARAAALVFPSTYEGFGLPPLEAMSAGCPVAASNSASIPEVVGDAAVLFDPHDPADIARGVLEALDDATRLAARGRARAASFTWSRCAAIHEEVYRALGG
jgi:glycosyltransferase involved in cell wall biosynthesis